MSSIAHVSLNIEGLNRLTAIPPVLTKLLEVLREDDADVSKLSRLIEIDAALSTKLLAAANSPAYRQSTQVNSIREGIMTMGWDMSKTLALNAAMHQILHEFSGSRIGLSIVAKMVNTLGGDIRCRSVIGSDTIFEIRLPYQSAMIGSNCDQSPPSHMIKPSEFL